MDPQTQSLLQEAQRMLSASTLAQGVMDILRQRETPEQDLLSRAMNVPEPTGTPATVLDVLRPRQPLRVEAFAPPQTELQMQPWEKALLPPRSAGAQRGVQRYGRLPHAAPEYVLSQLPAHGAYEKPAKPAPQLLTAYDEGIVATLSRKYPLVPREALSRMARQVAQLRAVADGFLRVDSVEQEQALLGLITEGVPAQQRALFLQIMRERMRRLHPNRAKRFSDRMQEGVLRGTVAIGRTLTELPAVIGTTADAKRKRDDLVFASQLAAMRRAMDPRPQSALAEGFYAAAEMAPQMLAGGLIAATGGSLATAAAIAFWATQMAPHHYAEFRSMGFSDTASRAAAVAVSIPEAAVELLQARDLVPPSLRNKVVRGAVAKGTQRVAKALGQNVSEATLRQSLERSARDFLGAYVREFGEEAAQNAMQMMAAGVLDAADETVALDWQAEVGQQLEQLRRAALALPIMMAPGHVLGTFSNLAEYREALMRSRDLPQVHIKQPGGDAPSTNIFRIIAEVQRMAEEASQNPQVAQQHADVLRSVVTSGEAGNRVARVGAAQQESLSEAYIRTLRQEIDEYHREFVRATKAGDEQSASVAIRQMYLRMRLLSIVQKRDAPSPKPIREPTLDFEAKPTAEEFAREEPGLAEHLLLEDEPASRMAFRRAGLSRWFRSKQEREAFVDELRRLAQPQGKEASRAEQEPQAAQVHGVVREEPQPGQREVPAEEGGRRVPGGGQAQREVPAQKEAEGPVGPRDQAEGSRLLEESVRAVARKTPRWVSGRFLFRKDRYTGYDENFATNGRTIIDLSALAQDQRKALLDVLDKERSEVRGQVPPHTPDVWKQAQQSQYRVEEIGFVAAKDAERATGSSKRVGPTVWFRDENGELYSYPAKDVQVLKVYGGATRFEVNPNFGFALVGYNDSDRPVGAVMRRSASGQTIYEGPDGPEPPTRKEVAHEEEAQHQEQEGHHVRRELRGHGVRSDEGPAEEGGQQTQERPKAQVAPTSTPEPQSAAGGVPAATAPQPPRVSVKDPTIVRSYEREYAEKVAKAAEEAPDYLGDASASAIRRIADRIKQIDDPLARLALFDRLRAEIETALKLTTPGMVKAQHYAVDAATRAGRVDGNRWLADTLREHSDAYDALFREVAGADRDAILPSEQDAQRSFQHAVKPLADAIVRTTPKRGSGAHEVAKQRYARVTEALKEIEAQRAELRKKLDKARSTKTIARIEKQLDELDAQERRLSRDEKSYRNALQLAEVVEGWENAWKDIDIIRWGLALLKYAPDDVKSSLGRERYESLAKRIDNLAHLRLALEARKVVRNPEDAYHAAVELHSELSQRPRTIGGLKRFVRDLLERYDAMEEYRAAQKVIEALPEEIRGDWWELLEKKPRKREVYAELRQEAEQAAQKWHARQRAAQEELGRKLRAAIDEPVDEKSLRVSVTTAFKKQNGYVGTDFLASGLFTLRADALKKADREKISRKLDTSSPRFSADIVRERWDSLTRDLEAALPVGLLHRHKLAEVVGQKVDDHAAWYVGKDGTQVAVGGKLDVYLRKVLNPRGFAVWDAVGLRGVAYLDATGKPIGILVGTTLDQRVRVPLSYADLAKRLEAGGSAGAMALLTVQPSSNPPPMVSERTGKTVTIGTIFERNWQARSIPPDVMFHMARRLIGNEPMLRKLRKNLGYFKVEDGEGRIVVSREVPADPNLLAAVLAHEIGHAEDWIPDKTLARGNLLGRIHKQKLFLKQTFGEGGPRNKEIREELIKLVEWWNGVTRDEMPPKYRKYKFSARELYAEALSVFLNDPAALQSRAPLFWSAWMEALDKRPEFANELANAYAMLHPGVDDRFQQNFDWFKLGYKRAEDVLNAAAKARRDAARSFSGGLYNYLIQNLVDKQHPAKSIVRQTYKSRGPIPRDDDPWLVEKLIHDLFYNHTIEKVTRERIDEIMGPVHDAGVTQDQVGFYMQMMRIVNDRGEIGNPGATTQEAAIENLAALERMIGRERMEMVQKAVQRLHDEVLFPIAQRAYRVGLISKETYQQSVLPSKGTYATFAVLRHLEEQMAISAGVHQQVGTFGQTANPYQATIIKMLKMDRWARLNEAKRGFLSVMAQYWPEGEIVEVETNRLTGAPKRQPRPGKGYIVVWEDGKKKHYEVDEYIAASFSISDPGTLAQAFNTIGAKLYPLMHPLLVKYNPDWLVRNPIRDVRRALRNAEAIVYAERKNFIKQLEESGLSHRDAVREAKKRFRFSVAEFVNEYLKVLSDPKRRSQEHIDELRRYGAIGNLFVDPFHGEQHRVTLPGDVLEVERPWDEKVILTRKRIVRPLSLTMRMLAEAGHAQELASKIAAWNVFARMGIGPHKRAMYVRTWIGTPDVHQRGAAHVVANSMFLYYRVRVDGLFADTRLAFSPQTAPGWWYHVLRWNVIPMILKKGAQYGLFGSGIAAMMGGLGNYYLNNYMLLIPIGRARDTDGKWKTLYLKVRDDDYGAMINSIVGHLIDIAVYDAVQQKRYPNRAAALAGMFGDVLREATPSLAPPFSIVGAYASYLVGRNPVDPFTGRPIVTRDAWSAGGWYAFREMLGWTIDQFGRWRWTAYNIANVAGLGDQEFTWEGMIRAIPGLRAYVGFAARGLDEEQSAALEAKEAGEARFRLRLPTKVRNLLKEHYFLNRAPEITDAQQTKRLLLNYWFSHVYEPVTHDAKAARDAGDRETERKLIAELEDKTEAYVEPKPGTPEWKDVAGWLLYRISSPTEENRRRLLERLGRGQVSPERARYLQDLKREIVTSEQQRSVYLRVLKELGVSPQRWDDLLRRYYEKLNRERAERTGTRPAPVAPMRGFRLTTFGQRLRRLRALASKAEKSVGADR